MEGVEYGFNWFPFGSKSDLPLNPGPCIIAAVMFFQELAVSCTRSADQQTYFKRHSRNDQFGVAYCSISTDFYNREHMVFCDTNVLVHGVSKGTFQLSIPSIFNR